MDDLLVDILSHLQSIQASRKGSIGALNNVYLPQLDVNHVDELAVRVLANSIILKSVSFAVPEEISVSREFADRIKLASEFTIEEPMLLKPGFYVVILGELFKPVYLEPFPNDANPSDL